MRTTADIPASLAEVDAGFLTRALREAGVLGDADSAGVRTFDTRIIGEGAGFMGEVARISLQYTAADPVVVLNAPASVILKIPTASRNRGIGQLLGVYEREIRCYACLQTRLGVRTPRVYFAGLSVADKPERVLKLARLVNRLPLWGVKLAYLLINFLMQVQATAGANWLVSKLPSGGRVRRKYVLLLEDLGDLRQGDQVAGCSRQDVLTVLDGMARLHANFWDSPVLDDYPWVIPMRDGAMAAQVVYLKALPHFLAAYEDSLTAHHLTLLHWLRAHGVELIEAISVPPLTLLHGDFRLDNLCFAGKTEDHDEEIVLFDWQTLLRGSPGMELANFLGASIELGSQLRKTPTDTQSSMLALVDYYGRKLREYGVEIAPDRLHWAYQAGMLLHLHRIVPAQFQQVLDLSGERGQQLMTIWVRRVLSHLDGIDADQLMRCRPSGTDSRLISPATSAVIS